MTDNPVRVIDLNAGTQRELKALMTQAQDIQDKIHLIARIYMDAIGEQGYYTLSKDCTKLVVNSPNQSKIG